MDENTHVDRKLEDFDIWPKRGVEKAGIEDLAGGPLWDDREALSEVPCKRGREQKLEKAEVKGKGEE